MLPHNVIEYAWRQFGLLLKWEKTFMFGVLTEQIQTPGL